MESERQIKGERKRKRTQSVFNVRKSFHFMSCHVQNDHCFV